MNIIVCYVELAIFRYIINLHVILLSVPFKKKRKKSTV